MSYEKMERGFGEEGINRLIYCQKGPKSVAQRQEFLSSDMICSPLLMRNEKSKQCYMMANNAGSLWLIGFRADWVKWCLHFRKKRFLLLQLVKWQEFISSTEIIIIIKKKN